jgi:hypothetical protein
MVKKDPNKTATFEYNDYGVNEVSEQIMNSYNSGFIDQDTMAQANDDVQITEG